MKIMNSNTRGIEENEVYIQKTPISDLSPTSELKPKSLIHIVQYTDIIGKPYQSMKMEIGTFEQKIYEAVQNTLKTSYWDTHEKKSDKHDLVEEGCPDGMSFKDLVEYLGRFNASPTEVPETATDGFVKHVYYDFDVLKRYAVVRGNELEDRFKDIDNTLDNIDALFSPKMGIFTTDEDGNLSTESVNHLKADDDTYCQMTIEEGNKISNEWEVPASGNLVIYGWIDSSKAMNNKSIPTSYCVVEANINSSDNSKKKNWEIISAQSVIPAKGMTYVGFNLPVRQGLVIRIRTGFSVGVKSGQFSNENDGYDSLANSTANGFKCQVYSNAKYVVPTSAGQ